MDGQTPESNTAPALHSTLYLLPKLAKKEQKIFLKSLNQYFTLKNEEPQKKQNPPYAEGIWKQKMFSIFPFCFHHSFPADQQHTEGLVCWRILIWTCVRSEFELREMLRVSQENIMTRATHPGTAVPRKEGKIKYNFILVAYGPQFLCFLLTAQNPQCCESTRTEAAN